MRQDPMRVGMIGLGAIGLAVSRLLRDRGADAFAVVGAVVRDPDRPRPADAPPVAASVSELLAARPEVVVEAGGHAALRQHGAAVLRGGCDLLMVSVGALADPALEAEIRAAARASGARARIASGGIGALDAIASAAIGGLDRVTHSVRKPARTLLDAAGAARLTAPREMFRGPAREGVVRFPESINVAAAVSLAGIGLDRTEVCVIADPAAEYNHHEVVAQGAFGLLRFEIRNVPSENPRTGRLVAMSLVHELELRRAALSVG